MTFLRLLTRLLGVIFLVGFVGAVLYVAISERNWVGAAILAMVFVPFIVIGGMQWRKIWSQRQENSVITSAFNRKYHKLDYYLLAAMALCALPIFWLYPHLPKMIDHLIDARSVIFATISATLFTAFMWQPNDLGKITNTRSSTILGVAGIAVGIWLLVKTDSERYAFIGGGFKSLVQHLSILKGEVLYVKVSTIESG